MKPGMGLLLVLLAPWAWAQWAEAQWQFGQPIDIAAGQTFHHLSASGRKALVVASGQVALAWEDDHSGTPRCYLAIKPLAEMRFEIRELGQGECYDPGLAALDHGRVAAIWEAADGVRVALADAAGIHPSLRLASSGGHGTLAWHAKLGLHAAWSQPEARWRRIWHSRVNIDGKTLSAAKAMPVDLQPAKDDQVQPTLASIASGHAIAWEDRRHGHTVVYTSRSDDAQNWSAPLRVSQNPTGQAANNLGRGTGAMRPSLTAAGADALAVAWLDKRDFLSGYDVYAAMSGPGGGNFGRNLKVQDSFGDSIAQWHAAIAGDARGNLAVAWDDERDGSADIWLAWATAEGFSDNVTPAAGPGQQSDPVLALDDAGTLHLAWIDRSADGHSRLRYVAGRFASQ